MNDFEEFEKLKGEYSRRGIPEDEKKRIEKEMRENLKKRTTKEEIVGLDGNSYCIDTCNVSGLLSISSALRYEENSKKANKSNDEQRQKLLACNKYTPDNPYYGSSGDVAGLNESKD